MIAEAPEITDDLLDALDTDRRDAFVLTQLVGLSYDEAAVVSGCPIGTIRSRVARARDDLQHAVRAAVAGRVSIQTDDPSAGGPPSGPPGTRAALPALGWEHYRVWR